MKYCFNIHIIGKDRSVQTWSKMVAAVKFGIITYYLYRTPYSFDFS